MQEKRFLIECFIEKISDSFVERHTYRNLGAMRDFLAQDSLGVLVDGLRDAIESLPSADDKSLALESMKVLAFMQYMYSEVCFERNTNAQRTHP